MNFRHIFIKLPLLLPMLLLPSCMQAPSETEIKLEKYLMDNNSPPIMPVQQVFDKIPSGDMAVICIAGVYHSQLGLGMLEKPEPSIYVDKVNKYLKEHHIGYSEGYWHIILINQKDEIISIPINVHKIPIVLQIGSESHTISDSGRKPAICKSYLQAAFGKFTISAPVKGSNPKEIGLVNLIGLTHDIYADAEP